MPLAPWAHHRTKVKADDYEREVAAWLAALGRDLPGLRVEHQERIETPDGAFRFDVTARFRLLDVEFLVLVECKDHVRPVEREDVQVLADRLRAAAAQKGILFSTNGFQKGAIEFAASRRIALVRFIDGNLTYETRSQQLFREPRPGPPPWADVPQYVGVVISLTSSGGWHQSVLSASRTEPLADFLRSD